MSKRTKIIIGIVLAICVAALLFYYFYYSPNTTTNNNGFPSSGNITSSSTNNVSNGTETGKQSNQNGQGTNQAQTSILREITPGPISGAVIFNTSNTANIRYVDRGTGHVYQTSADSSAVNRITNTTIPKINETIFNPTGSSFVARYLKSDDETIQSFFGNIKTSSSSVLTANGSVTGDFMPVNIKQVAISPSGNKIFYLTDKNLGTVGVIANVDGTQKLQIFTSDLKEWIVFWPKEDTIILNTKASVMSPGYVFTLNSKTGKLTKILDSFNGLTTLFNQNLSYGLYSESRNGSFSLNILNVKNNNSINTTVQTLPEKCVWSKNDATVAYCAVPTIVLNGDYPDAWYQGVVSFSDDIWKLNATNGTAEIIARLRDLTTEDIDGINLSLSQKDDYLLFTNKTDLSLWMLKITNN
ncbi:MAG: hypothetical protein WCT19_02350 [Candidatus Paceibacterota bacterium]